MATHDLLKPKPGLKVLVTGGAAGIGAAIAEAFAEAGGAVFVCDIDPKAVAAITARGSGIRAAVADVGRKEDADRIVAEAVAAQGGLDVLVNNAGIAGPTGRVEDLDAADWDGTVATNLNSQFYFLRAAVPHLKQSEAGSIVALSSVAGRLGYAFRTPYAASKWAVVGLMKSLAIELGPENVRVNAVLPGVVAGPRMERVISARAEATRQSVGAMTDSYLSKISLRRMVTMEDVAALVLFLSSPAAVNITGQAISVDGNVEYL
jgi:NAD(P)-dependent dehydrogenase (short-subunit alcohol dehydrogenase family)